MAMFAEGDEHTLGLREPAAATPMEQPAPPPVAGRELTRAALENYNSVVSVVAAASQQSFPPEDGYSALPDIEGTKYYDQYADRFAGSQSRRETYSIIAQIEREEGNDRMLDQAGKLGTVLKMGAGTLDPTMALPGGVAVKAGKEGLTFLEAGLRVGKAALIQSGTQELALQLSQRTRSLEESALNVGSATLLSGLMGGAATRFMEASERAAALKGLDVERKWMNAHAGNIPVPDERPAEAITAAAVRAKDGSIFTGIHHGDALEAAEKAGHKADDLIGLDGFLTSSGRYVDRVEASKIASAAKQIEEPDKFLENIKAEGKGAERDRARIEAAHTGEGPLGAQMLKGALERRIDVPELRGDPVVANEDLEAPGPMASSVGAAATDERTMVPVPTILDKIPVLGKLLEGSNPMSRILGSTSLAARRALGTLVEIPTLLKQNLPRPIIDPVTLKITGYELGRTTTLGGGAALERNARMIIASTRVKLGDELQRQWIDLRFKGKPAPYFARTRAAFGQLDNPDNLPTFEQFKDLVGRAGQTEDKGEYPQVSAAAKMVRDNLYDPWLKRAQAIGIIDKNIDVKTAASYAQRLWNKQAIMAKRPEFVNANVKWLTEEQEKNAATQARVQAAHDQLRSTNENIRKIDEAIDRNEKSSRDLMVRLDERAKEVARTGGRVEALESRAQEQAAAIADAEQFIRETRLQTQDPATLQKLDAMERDVRELRRMDRPMTEAQLRDLEDEELKSQLTGTNRMAAQMLVGTRKYPKAPSFMSWLVANGGLKDEGGEVAGAIGGANQRPGLINNQRGRAFDQMGEKIQNEFPGSFPTTDDTGHGAPGRDEILNWISESGRGHEPAWWMDELSPADRQTLEAGKIAGALDEALNRAGVKVENIKDVAKIFRDEHTGSVRLADLDKIAKDMEAAGQSVPVSIRRQGAEDELAIAREDVNKLRQLIASAQAGNAARAKRLGNTEIRQGEAQLAERANRGRLGIIEDRLSRQDLRSEILQDARAIAQKQHDDMRAKLEEHIGEWRGTSGEEAKSAIKEREAAAAGKAEGRPRGRSTSADHAVDVAVQRILEKDTNLDTEALRELGQEITNHVLGSPEGRLPYDFDSGGPVEGHTGPGSNSQPPRGPLAERSYNIPDEMVNDFLHHDVEHIINAHLRTIVPDVMLAEQFGDVRMTDVFRKIEDEYAAAIDRTADQAERTRLGKERDVVLRDMAAMRDRIRGMYGAGASQLRPNAARWAAAIKNYNVLSSMGVAAISSLPDLAGPVARYGLNTVFRDAWAPFVRSLMSGGELNREAFRQFRAMGIVVESEIAARHHSLTDTLDSFHPHSRVERTLQVGADRFQFINALGPYTDLGKLITSTVASQEIFRAAEAATAGTATFRQLRQLAESNINNDMAARIAKEYRATGAVVDGVHLPNTGQWTDQEARRVFEGALGREADIAIVTPGQEKPLWMSDPILSVLGQFKSFQAAATQRILIANLQRHDAQVLQGFMFSIALGALSYKANSLLGGQPTSENPADWVKEALSRGNAFGWIEEGNAMSSKLTRGQLDMYRMLGSKKELSRYAGRSVMDEVLGPTAGKVEKLQQVIGAGLSRDWKESDTHAVHQITAYGNVFWLRNILNEVEKGANNAFGIPMRDRQ
jgi:hypothetical protein